MARIAAADLALHEIFEGMPQTPHAGMWKSRVGRWSAEIDSLLALNLDDAD